MNESLVAAYRESALLLAAGIEAEPLALVVASELRGQGDSTDEPHVTSTHD